jgi:hypothetical protein
MSIALLGWFSYDTKFESQMNICCAAEGVSEEDIVHSSALLLFTGIGEEKAALISCPVIFVCIIKRLRVRSRRGRPFI